MTPAPPTARAALAASPRPALARRRLRRRVRDRAAPSRGAASSAPRRPRRPRRPPRPPSAASPPAGPRPVRLALDWTPNTNHLGFYVADAKGWYAEAGIDARGPARTAARRPRRSSRPTRPSAGSASRTRSRSRPRPARRSRARWRSSSTRPRRSRCSRRRRSQRPRDLDGKTYAGFGYPNEVPTLQAVIKDDGGTGDFDTVTLDTAAYEALYQQRADFVITFSAWEGIEAGQRGIPLRTFQFTDYGFPDFYQVVLACDARLARARPGGREGLRRCDRPRASSSPPPNPDEAAQILVDAEPGRVRRQPGPARWRRRATSPSRGCWSTRPARPAPRRSRQWTGYSAFLYDQGLLADADGKPLTAPPDYALAVHERLPPRAVSPDGA